MKYPIRLLAGLVVPAFMLAGVATNPALAQDKAKDAKAAPAAKVEKGKVAPKVLLDNDKAKAFEVAWKPGDVNASVPSSAYRVVRALKGGTLERTYADGKTEKVEWKTGEVRMNEPSKQGYTAKNIGKSEIVLFVVQLK